MSDPWAQENPLKPNLGEARMCMKVFSELHRVDREDHPWAEKMRPVLEPRSYGEFSVVVNEEIPPDRVVFVDTEGEVIATIMLEQQEEQ